MSNTGATYVYGILGSLYNSVPVTIESCINYGDIVLKQDWDSAAGISTYPDEFVTIKKCANYGTITAGTAYGICDSMGSMTDTCPPTSATIEDCANYGDISSNYFSAGITGRIGVMKRCINLGHITATYNAAPEGKNDSVRSIAYYVEHKSGLYYLVGDLAESNGIDEVVGAPLTLQEFSSQSNLKEFDFKTVWTMGKVNDNTVPVLGVPTEKTQACRSRFYQQMNYIIKYYFMQYIFTFYFGNFLPIGAQTEGFPPVGRYNKIIGV